MSSGVGFAAAFAGGTVSFLSPCVLPIVPGYLTLITGLDVTADTPTTRARLVRIARDTGLFVAGFSVVFITFGLAATSAGRVRARHHQALTRTSGLVILAFALFLAGSLVLRLPWLYQERRWHPDLGRFGPFAAPVAGIAFGFGWTPCIGPVLGSVLAVAATDGSGVRGAALLAAYSLGLGLPFMLTGLLYGRLIGALGWVRRHSTGLTVAAAVAMAGFGLLLTLNRLTWVTSQLQAALHHVGLDSVVTLG